MGLAVRELLYERRRYLLIGALLVLLMFMVPFLSGLATGLQRAVASAVQDMDVDYFLVQESAEKVMTVSDLPVEALEDLSGQTDAELSPLDIQRMYLQRESDAEKLNVTYFAIDPERKPKVRPKSPFPGGVKDRRARRRPRPGSRSRHDKKEVHHVRSSQVLLPFGQHQGACRGHRASRR